MSGRLFLAEITCGGGALFDADSDGDLDVYLLQGRELGKASITEALVAPAYSLPLTDRLYRNDLVDASGESKGPAGLAFTDITESLGDSGTGYGCGIATGDFDGDGNIDLYVVNLGRNQLLRNLGPDGHGGIRFADVTDAAGVGDEGPGTTALFFDVEGDGDLDLFVGNYGDFHPRFESPCFDLSGAPDYCGPGAYPPRPDRLYLNLEAERAADPTSVDAALFVDITERSGLGAAPPRATLGSVASDFDGDGDLDLYLAHDGEPNYLWLNRGDGTFEERALEFGAALNGRGAAEASMGVDAGDIDNDGDEDLFLAHLIKETNTLYLNDGRANFRDAATASGLGAPSLPFTSFGAAFLDVDNDGLLDLAVASGAVTRIPSQAAAGDILPLRQADQLFLQVPSEGPLPLYENISGEAGAEFSTPRVSRGLAVGDIDNDGDADLLITTIAGPARLLINETENQKPWLGLRLLTGIPPRDALGAKAALLVAGEPVLWRRLHSDGSFASAQDPRLLFGLANEDRASKIDGVRVHWPDGQREEFTLPGEIRRTYWTLSQGDGRAVAGER